MRNKKALFPLAAYALLCAALAVFGGVEDFLGRALAFPFGDLGRLLRRLSLGGGTGNFFALIIYFVICLLPLLPAAAKLRRGSFDPKDWLLVLLSPLLLAVMYMMVNPGLLSQWGADSLPHMRAAAGGVCWSVIVSWLVLSLLRDLQLRGRQRALRWGRVLLWAMAAVFVTRAFGEAVGRLVSTLQHVRLTNTGRPEELAPTYFVLALQFAVTALPNILSALVALRTAELLRAMDEDRYGEEAVAMAEELGSFCLRCLQATVLACLLFNLAQLPFLRELAVVSISVNIPIMDMAFVLAALLLARFMRENKQLKDDNDLFI